MGSTVDNDCPDHFPAHLHQEVTGYWAKNTDLLTKASCDNDYGCRTDNVWDIYHSSRTWTASGY